MLSRVADGLYWMSRYIERVENIARFLDVNWHLTLDGPSTPDTDANAWTPLVAVTGDLDIFRKQYPEETRENVLRFLTLDGAYPNSVYSCLRAARENGRTLREIISGEMWEHINTLYHRVERETHNPSRFLDNPYSLCNEIRRCCLTLYGMAQDTMDHDEAWLFYTMGRHLERADKTSRILDVKYFILLPKLEDVGSIVDHVQWAALLKAASGFQAYRRRCGRIKPLKVAEFLILDHTFPRSILYCLNETQRCLHEISGTRIGYFSNDAEKLLGQLCTEMSYDTIEDIFNKGLHEFTDSLQSRMNAVGEAIFRTFIAPEPVQEVMAQQQ